RRRIKTAMSAYVGVERSADGLRRGLAELDRIEEDVAALGESLPEITVRNMLASARAIAGAALHREESRGGHSRADFPATDPRLDYRHSILAADGDWRFGSLATALVPRRLSPAYITAMQRFWERSDYDKGIITNPFGFDDAAGERGLARTRGVVERLGNPLANLPVIHVAGSKGKGSTTACLASVLTAAGYRTGRYTSPHLHSFRERIAVDGEPISEADFAIAFERALTAAEQLERDQPDLGRVTAFELITAASFDHFARSGCAIAIIETGLGGRWDASNVVDPLVSVITLIDLEHTDVLGDTLAQIAREKAGIIKPGRPVVTLDQAPDVLDVFRSAAMERNAPLAIEGRDWRVSNDWNAAVYEDDEGRVGPFRTGLRGAHQVRNAGLAIAALRRLHGFELPDAAIVAGLANAWLPGRHEIVPGQPMIVIDGAHSPASARALAETIRRDYPDAAPNDIAVIFGMLKGKNAGAFLRELGPVAQRATLVPIDSPRAMPLEDLERGAADAGIATVTASDVAVAIDRLREEAVKVILITGSLALAAAARVALGLGEPEVIPQASRNA
ncbi:MAG: hypothetical protein IT334_11850, partial [Thermomicrobiales bacterium]|nr:hypothetical protein [Thermomicrobiales bacterium]